MILIFFPTLAFVPLTAGAAVSVGGVPTVTVPFIVIGCTLHV